MSLSFGFEREGAEKDSVHWCGEYRGEVDRAEMGHLVLHELDPEADDRRSRPCPGEEKLSAAGVVQGCARSLPREPRPGNSESTTGSRLAGIFDWWCRRRNTASARGEANSGEGCRDKPALGICEASPQVAICCTATAGGSESDCHRAAISQDSMMLHSVAQQASGVAEFLARKCSSRARSSRAHQSSRSPAAALLVAFLALATCFALIDAQVIPPTKSCIHNSSVYRLI